MFQGKVYTVTMDGEQFTSSKCELLPKHLLSFIQKVGSTEKLLLKDPATHVFISKYPKIHGISWKNYTRTMVTGQYFASLK